MTTLKPTGSPQFTNTFKEFAFWGSLILAFLFFMFPLYWMLATSIKPRAEVELTPPAFIPFVDFEPTLNNYVDVFLKDRAGAGLAETDTESARAISEFPTTLTNSIIITVATTVTAVLLGTLAAYTFSRFDVPGESDMLFFILSTKMLPPVVVLIPIFLMFSQPGKLVLDVLHSLSISLPSGWEASLQTFTLRDSYLGLTLLYTTFGLPFVVWMMKGFFDEIPKEYEEAAMLDGYSRLEAIWKIVLPEAFPAMLATSVFVIITAWNEFIFALLLNRNNANTVPPFLYSTIGYGQVEWGRMAATSVLYLIPLAIFTYLARNHLLRGVTFGAVRR
ncbi:MAG: carbohydrate ABC transporter permease [Anaerolineaceae bacterium]|nr:carbohydrate ABC transporter permease [Anaerolineaceae bacterium]